MGTKNEVNYHCEGDSLLSLVFLSSFAVAFLLVDGGGVTSFSILSTSGFSVEKAL